jgi:hypothetical protein
VGTRSRKKERESDVNSHIVHQDCSENCTIVITASML